MQRDEARRLLGVAPGTPVAEIERAFRRRASIAHPDRGGDAESFRRLVAARSLLTTAQSLRTEAGGFQPGPDRPRMVIRRSPARRLLRALRSRLGSGSRSTPRVH